MNWKLFAKSQRRRTPQMSFTRFRPHVDCLEDRMVLSPVLFSLDPSSSLTLSGSINGSAITQQGPGSLTTTYQGTLSADVASDDSTISFFNDGNTAAADDSGSWQPLPNGASGSASANYGGQVNLGIFGTARAAVRGLQVSASADSLGLTDNGDGTLGFTSNQTLIINAGSAAYNASVGQGAADLSNQSAQNNAAAGTVIDNGDGTYVLVAPINLTISQTVQGIPVVLNIRGTITAYGALAGPHQGHGDTGLGIALAAGADVTTIAPPLGTVIGANTVSVNPLGTIDTQVGQQTTQNGRVDSVISLTAHHANQVAVADAVFQDLGHADGITL